MVLYAIHEYNSHFTYKFPTSSMVMTLEILFSPKNNNIMILLFPVLLKSPNDNKANTIHIFTLPQCYYIKSLR